jgi:hypothetical protein
VIGLPPDRSHRLGDQWMLIACGHGCCRETSANFPMQMVHTANSPLMLGWNCRLTPVRVDPVHLLRGAHPGPPGRLSPTEEMRAKGDDPAPDHMCMAPVIGRFAR